MPTRTGEDYLRLKDRIIDRTLRELNPMQRQAAKAVTGPVLVLAGAGSGKTTVLVHRIATLLRFGTAPDTSEDFPGTLSEEDWALLERAAGSGEELEEASGILARSVPEPWNILAITFTNKAASELKNRLELLLGAQGAGVAASTFHSACARILRREIGVLGYSGRFTIYDTDDSVRVMKQVLRDLSVSDRLFSPKEILGRISRAKDIMWSPRDLQEHAGRNYALQVAGRAYGEYQKKLRADNAVDFDDLIFLTVRLFQEHPEILERYQRRFRYILVDEYQDTNHAQYLLISLLAGKHGNLFVVGDDDQSIYRFRGATIENILSFENRFQQARVIRLEQNYRSTRVILEAANAVIGHNRERKGKTLWTDNAEGERITVSRLEDERAEATFVARRIRADHEAGTPYRDNAILYRLNAQSNSMEWALRSHGIPYRVFGGLKFFDRKEVKDILSYLAVVSNPADDLRFRRIVNEPKRGIGNTTLERASEIAEALGQSVFETCSQAEDYPALAEKAAALRGITGWIARLAGQADEAPLTETLDAVLECSGYVRALRQKKSDENEARIQNIEELRSTVINYERETEEPTLSGFLEEIALFTDLDSLRESEDAVLMMTLHSSKGLEFENVYLIGMEENIFPGYQSGGSPELLEEERRLAYVGITRARRRLTLLCAERRMLYGRTSCNPVSRFIAEIPGNCTGPGRPPAGAGRAPRDRRTFPSGAAGAPERKRTAAPPGPAAAFAAGDRVRHPVFGFGLVRNARIIGGDQLLEIVFEKAGVKKIMANFAKLEKQ